MKPIKISEYKEHAIMYDQEIKEFYGEKGKEKTALTPTEKGCMAEIDTAINERNEEELTKLEKIKAEKEIKKQEKNLSKCKIIVASDKFKRFISAINKVVSEVKLKVTGAEIEVTEMDPANVLLFHKELKLEEKTVPFDFPINLAQLTQFLQNIKCSKKKNIEITFGFEEETKTCFIKSEEATFSLPLIELEERKVKIPELNFECVLKITKGDFNRAISLCDCASDKVSFVSTGDELRFLSQGDLMKIETRSFLCKGNAKAKYSQEYLKVVMLDDNLKIEFKNNYPVKISDDKGDWYMIAPRTEEGD